MDFYISLTYSSQNSRSRLVLTPITVMMSMSNFMRFMTYNTGTVVTLLMSFFTVSVDSLLALLNIDGVNNLLTFLLWDLARVFLGVLVTLHLLLVFTMMLMTRIS